MNLYSFLKEVQPLALYDVEHGTAMEPMKGKWASSRVDLGYTELVCIPEVTAEFPSSCDIGLGTLLCSIKYVEAPYVFYWEHGIALHPMQVIRPHLHPRGTSHGISRVAAKTWGLVSSYSGDGHSKIYFLQRSQDSCLVRTETSGI